MRTNNAPADAAEALRDAQEAAIAALGLRGGEASLAMHAAIERRRKERWRGIVQAARYHTSMRPLRPTAEELAKSTERVYVRHDD